MLPGSPAVTTSGTKLLPQLPSFTLTGLCHVLTFQVSCVRLWDRGAGSLPESHDGAPPVGARLLLAALLRVRPRDQPWGGDEGAHRHARSGRHSRDEVGVQKCAVEAPDPRWCNHENTKLFAELARGAFLFHDNHSDNKNNVGCRLTVLVWSVTTTLQKFSVYELLNTKVS